MAEEKKRLLVKKVIIQGIMECVTGLHIGTSKDTLEIGGIDAPVIRDPITKEPYIPGSSLRGKLRALLERKLPNIQPNRNIGTSEDPVWIHVCDNGTIASQCPLCRIFGSTGKDGGTNFPSRLKIRDLRLTPEGKKDLETIETGLLYTEWKFENAIDRITAAANPRQIERIPAGAKFAFQMVYDVEIENEKQQDLQNIIQALELLENDALGGQGSRGYGKVKFKIEIKEDTELKEGDDILYSCLKEREEENWENKWNFKSIKEWKKENSCQKQNERKN